MTLPIQLQYAIVDRSTRPAYSTAIPLFQPVPKTSHTSVPVTKTVVVSRRAARRICRAQTRQERRAARRALKQMMKRAERDAYDFVMGCYSDGADADLA